MSTIPDDLDALLLRVPVAEALTQKGFPIKAKTLATMATRGGGPPYRLFGQRAVYRWGDALEWADARMTKPRTSSAEADAEKVERQLANDIAFGENRKMAEPKHACRRIEESSSVEDFLARGEDAGSRKTP